ncbi:MAG TPA: thiamine phosphate synthase [Caulobacteraceae bacterium]
MSLKEPGIETLWRWARTLERRVVRGKPLPALLFFTDPHRTPDPQAIVARMPRGSGVVYRAFGSPDAVWRGAALARVARRRGVFFLVGADAGLARRLRADGLHLPERMAGRPGDIRALARRFLITTAAHSLPAAIKARRCGVGAVVVSMVFASESHPGARAMGRLAFASLVRSSGAAVYALGGVNVKTARGLRPTGAVGLAAIGAFGA